MSSSEDTAEHLLRELAPQVLGAIVRRFGDFSAAEDAVQEALLAATLQWPREGVPDNPRGWLIHVAARRMTDHIRSELSRRRRETRSVMQTQSGVQAIAASDTLSDPFAGRFGEVLGVDHAERRRYARSSCSCAAIRP